MKVTKRKNRIMAFCLAIMFGMLQVLSSSGMISLDGAMKAEAASAQDTSGIAVVNATGTAFTVDPNMVVTGFTVTATTTTTLDFGWTAAVGATSYNIYKYNGTVEQYELVAATQELSYQLTGLEAGGEHYITICAINEEMECRSEFLVPVCCYTRPEKVETITFKSTTTTINLKWEEVPSATGYLIYRAGTGGNFKLIGAASIAQYDDTGLTVGKTYQYKIVTYAYTTDNTGEESPAQFTSTLTEAATIKAKAGDGKVRLSWSAVTKAVGYIIYIYQDSTYVPLTTLEGKSNTTYIHTGLENGKLYQYYVTAYRTYNDVIYESSSSNIDGGTPMKVAATSTKATLFANKKAFKASDAYKNCKDFSKKVKYKKSVPIPGVTLTNVAGFACTNMVPQGLTIAKSYIFMTAYDQTGEENSVIYVVKKSSKKLMTTIVLPNKAHAGGIAFDGTNLWIAQAKTLRSIPYSAVSSAIKNQKPYVEIAEYDTVNTLAQQAATIAYYKKILWVASYDELKSGYLCSYQIGSKSSKPALTLLNTIRVPTRVQGITFTFNGRLIVSRSCQTDSTKRGFFHQLDVYKPDLKQASKGIISLGNVRNQIDMPTMNEEVAVSGSLVYVNFESVSFSSAVNRMDRICALPVSFVTKLTMGK